MGACVLSKVGWTVMTMSTFWQGMKVTQSTPPYSCCRGGRRPCAPDPPPLPGLGALSGAGAVPSRLLSASARHVGLGKDMNDGADRKEAHEADCF